MKQQGWIPILEDADAAEAHQAIAAIIAALQALPAEKWSDPSVASGHAGSAILYGYLAQALPKRSYELAASTELDIAIAAVATSQLPPFLYSGFPGVGWAVEQLRDIVPGIDQETNQGIDQGVLTWLAGRPWEQDYDLVSGLVGLGIYAVSRLPHEGGVLCLKQVIDRLAETAQKQADGFTWWTRPELLNDHSAMEYPQGWYDVGLAHGQPGVIALLGEVYSAGIERERVRELLSGAVRWLLQHQQPEDAGSVFPMCFRPGLIGPPLSSRSAWCYGDPGVAAALMLAARRVGETTWEAAALAIARKAAQRPAEQAGVVDGGLCHGSAGLGHIFNRFFQATGESLFRDAARFWLGRTLNMRQPSHGLAGYLTLGPRPEPRTTRGVEKEWTEDPGLLTGVTGIALALLAAVSPVEPEWDRLLLTNM